MINTGLTAGEAARRLGVAVTTLRSWHHRYGLGPTQHVAGHHRRYGPEDVARLELMRALTAQGVPAATAARLAATGLPATGLPATGLPATAPTAPPTDRLPGGDPAVRGLVGAASRLDAVSVRQVLAAALADRGAAATWNELVRPALRRIEARQVGAHATTGGLVEVEHLLSAAASQTFATVPGPDTSPQAMLACAEDEQHSLPLEALAAALAQRGVGAWLLGARVPAAALSAAVRRTGPGLVVVWSHTPGTADPAPLVTVRDSRPRPAVVAAAGPGWPPTLPAGLTRLTRFPQAVALAETVAAAAAEPVAGRDRPLA